MLMNVNEEGTEAAAATAIVATFRSLPPPTPKFTAEHPFVNEEGTEAAAATGIVMTKKSSSTPKPKFIADQPFIMCINKGSELIFIGIFTG
uniref:Serpin domain-containing protein n=1 Tax=Meloidogyne floridensis TaxID=298350 RepID=A0A915P7W5_9BILA